MVSAAAATDPTAVGEATEMEGAGVGVGVGGCRHISEINLIDDVGVDQSINRSIGSDRIERFFVIKLEARLGWQ